MTPASLFPSDDELPTLTDLYQLTMAAAYHAQGLHDRRATFELFVRRLPDDRSFLLASGLEQFLHAATQLRFPSDAVAYVRTLPAFQRVGAAFFEALAAFRFTGDVHAMPEGTVAFAGEPLLRVSGTLLEAQILESIAINALNYQTAVATKAARVVMAARGRPVVDFGMRRCPGPQASLLAARACLIGGCATTSNVAAARRFAYEPTGTMAHSWIMAHDDEEQAFTKYADLFGERTTALVDTYDVETGIRRATRLGPRLAAIRLDSGDLAAQARTARSILDAAGCRHTKIFVSGDMNEFKIDELLASGAPVDAFGVGTEMVTVADAPSLSTVYKLVELAGPDGRPIPRQKRSADKATLGYAKQVYRRMRDGRITGDILARANAAPAEGTPLLEPVILKGRLTAALPTVRGIAERAARGLQALPDPLRRFRGVGAYPVTLDSSLTDCAACAG